MEWQMIWMCVHACIITSCMHNTNSCAFNVFEVEFHVIQINSNCASDTLFFKRAAYQ